MKLDSGQKHFLRLIARDADAEGWTKVSKQIFPLIGKYLPSELVELQAVGEDGRGRTRLTVLGDQVLHAMDYL